MERDKRRDAMKDPREGIFYFVPMPRDGKGVVWTVATAFKEDPTDPRLHEELWREFVLPDLFKLWDVSRNMSPYHQYVHGIPRGRVQRSSDNWSKSGFEIYASEVFGTIRFAEPWQNMVIKRFNLQTVSPVVTLWSPKEDIVDLHVRSLEKAGINWRELSLIPS